jgi:hypothetical protein
MIFSVNVPRSITGSENQNFNDLARVLAGMPVSDKSPYYRLTTTDSFKRHASWMDGYWKRVEKENIAPITQWRKAIMPGSFENKPAYYPLSGADFVNLYAFYPKARYYVMMALEDPGPVPDVLKLNEAELAGGFAAIQRCIMSVAIQNYFMSRVMIKEIPNKYLSGVTPIIMAFAARMNCRVNDVEPVGLSESGSVRKLDKDGKISGKDPVSPGCRISLTAQNDGRDCSVTYLKVKLNGQSLKETTPEGQFLNKVKGFNAILKSAVYLLHMKRYKEFCDDMLIRSNVIVQDDSGIPYRYFDSQGWTLSLFGTYVYPKPLKEIPNPPYQPELAKGYRERSMPLPFNFGYGVARGKGMSNLLLAVKAYK